MRETAVQPPERREGGKGRKSRNLKIIMKKLPEKNFIKNFTNAGK